MVGFARNLQNRQGVDDPEYNAIFQAAVGATTAEELKEWATAGDMYALDRHWFTWGPLAPLFQASQPWVVGYNGEVTLGG